MTYRVFWVVLDRIFYLPVGTIIDVCRPIVPPETREDSGSYWCQLKTQTDREFQHLHLQAYTTCCQALSLSVPLTLNSSYPPLLCLCLCLLRLLSVCGRDERGTH